MEANMRRFLISTTKKDEFFIARCPELGVTSLRGKHLKKYNNTAEGYV
jgi:hypothetical protein